VIGGEEEFIDGLIIGDGADSGDLALEGIDEVAQGFTKLLIDSPEQSGQSGDIAVRLEGVADDLIEIGAASALIDVLRHESELGLKGVDDVLLRGVRRVAFLVREGASAGLEGVQTGAEGVSKLDADGLCGLSDDVFSEGDDDGLDAAGGGELGDVLGEFAEGAEAEAGDGASEQGLDDDGVVDGFGEFLVKVMCNKMFGLTEDGDGFAWA
jgi:hypothetical protein